MRQPLGLREAVIALRAARTGAGWVIGDEPKTGLEAAEEGRREQPEPAKAA